MQVTLYGTASALQSAIATLPGVASCTVTGGPLCHADVHVEIEWSTTTGNLSKRLVDSNDRHSRPSLLLELVNRAAGTDLDQLHTRLDHK